MEGVFLYPSVMRSFLLLALVFLSACSPSGDRQISSAPQTSQLDNEQDYDLGEDGPAPPVEPGYAPVVRQEGYELARDAAVLGIARSSTTASPGLDAPEVGTGKYANPEWKLPGMGVDLPAEMRPQPVEEIQVPRKDEKIIPHERVIEEIPNARIVEDIP